MARAFRHGLIWSLVVALVTAGAWRPCAVPQMASQALAANHHEHATHDVAHSGTGHQHHQPAADNNAMPIADDHGCIKCCAMCAATAARTFLDVTMTFAFRSFMIAADPDEWSSCTIAVDPGIPKRIA